MARLVANGHTYEQDGALWLKSTDYGDDKDRVMKKSDGGYTYFLPDVAYHIQKWQRGFHKGGEHPGTGPPRHHRPRARRPAGGRCRHSQGYPTMCCTPWCAWCVAAGVKISKRAGSYVTLRDLIEWTSKDAVRFFLSRKPDTEYTFDVDLAVAQNK